MGVFDDLLIGGAGLAFVEHEHTKHQRQRFEQQYALEQQQMQYQNGPQGGGQYRGGYAQQQYSNTNFGPGAGYPAGPPPMQYGACCPNCGYTMGGPQQLQQQQQGVGYQPPQGGAPPMYRGSPPVPSRSPAGGKQ